VFAMPGRRDDCDSMPGLSQSAVDVGHMEVILTGFQFRLGVYIKMDLSSPQ
jgi:hypothetical protein